MKVTKEISQKFRFSIYVEKKEVARGSLFLITNDLHEEPYGLVEDVFTDEKFRGKGYGNQILKAIFKKAKQLKCYKLIACSRKGKSRKLVHEWYERYGFRRYGHEFRVELV